MDASCPRSNVCRFHQHGKARPLGLVRNQDARVCSIGSLYDGLVRLAQDYGLRTILFLDGARLDPRESKDQIEQTCCV